MLETPAYRSATSQKQFRKSGFSLVELSIVLVILGLLTGGILAGRSLIELATIRKTITELDNYKVAVNTFRLRFNGLPGDITNATSIFTDVQNGDGNWQIQYWNEGLYAWMELAQAGLIPGSYVGTAVADPTPGENVPASAYDPGAGYSFAWEVEVAWPNNFNITGNVIHFGRPVAGQTTKDPVLPPAVAYAIDMKLDDGMPALGSIHSWDTNFTPDCITASAPDAEYNMSDESIACSLLFKML